MNTGRLNWPANDLNQTVVYWANPTPTGAGGRGFDDPIEVDARWEQKQELFIDVNGQELRSRAVVHIDQAVDLGGYLYLGTLADLSSAEEGDPLSISAAYEIRNVAYIPDVKATKHLRKAWL